MFVQWDESADESRSASAEESVSAEEVLGSVEAVSGSAPSAMDLASVDSSVPSLRLIPGGLTDQACTSTESQGSLDSVPDALGRIEAIFESLRSNCTDHVGEPSGEASTSGVDFSHVTDDDLLESVASIEQLRRSLDSFSVALVGELHSRGTTDEVHGMRTGSWLAHEAGLASGAANAHVNLSKTLRIRLADVRAALDSGEIGYQHTKVLTDAAIPRIIDEFEKMVPHLLSLVPLMSFNRWKREVAGVVALLDQDGGHQPGDEITDNVLRLSPSWGGTLGVQGQLTGDGAVVVAKALNDRADQIFHRMTKDNGLTGDLPVPPRKTLLALALVELIREGLAKDGASSSAPRTEAALVINANDPTMVTDETGVPIGNMARSTLMCDPVFKPVVMSFDGLVLDLGRDHRLASRALRQALAHRDGGCVWPGCDGSVSWCDAHHVEEWEHGGSTDRENIGLLCRYHHGVTHRNGWSMNATPDQWFWWQSPSGDTFWSQRHGVQRTGPPPPKDWPTNSWPPGSGPDSEPSGTPPGGGPPGGGSCCGPPGSPPGSAA